MKKEILRLIESAGPIKRINLLHQIHKIQVQNNVSKESYIPLITDRKMRLLIVELIQDGEPIASSEKGYSIIKNVRELTEAVNYLKAKSKSISIRGNTLIGNYDLKYQNAPASLQFKLF